MIGRLLRGLFGGGSRSGSRDGARSKFIDELHAHMEAVDLAAAIEALGIEGKGDDAALSVEIGVLARTMRLLNALEFDEVPHCLEVRPSPLCASDSGDGGAAAGLGVFATAPIAAGSVVAMYPGGVYTASQLRSVGGSRFVDPHGCNDYVMFRSSDGACFDAAPVVDPSSCAQGDPTAHWSDATRAAAVGHLLNHASAAAPGPQQQPPNALPWPLDLEERDAARLAPYLPNYDGMAFHAMSIERPRPSTALLAILTTHAIAADEELLIDYRLELGLDPASAEYAEALPPWYAPVPDLSGTRPVWSERECQHRYGSRRSET